MVALALFYQTQAIHLLFFCNRGSVSTTEFVISHSTACSRFFTLCHMLWRTRLNYSDLEIIWRYSPVQVMVPPNFHTSKLHAFPLPLLSRPSASFANRFLVIRAARIQLARIARSIVACVSRRKSLVPSQISDHVFQLVHHHRAFLSYQGISATGWVFLLGLAEVNVALSPVRISHGIKSSVLERGYALNSVDFYLRSRATPPLPTSYSCLPTQVDRRR